MVANAVASNVILNALLIRGALGLGLLEAAGRQHVAGSRDPQLLIAKSRDAHSSKTGELLARAERLSREEWARSGPESERKLRERFLKSAYVQEQVQSRCGGQSRRRDCEWQQEDALLCEALELAGARDQLGNLTVVEQIAKSTIASSWVYGVNATIRGMMIARWMESTPETIDSPSPDVHHPYSKMQAALLESRKLQRRAEEACEGLAEIRPGCHSAARHALYCQALGQAAGILVGEKELASRLEEALQLRSDAAQIVGSDAFSRLGARSRHAVRRALSFGMQQWLQSGSSAWRTLKIRFVSNALAMQEAKKACRSLSDHECVLKRLDPFLCTLLESVGSLASAEVESDILASINRTRQRMEDSLPEKDHPEPHSLAMHRPASSRGRRGHRALGRTHPHGKVLRVKMAEQSGEVQIHGAPEADSDGAEWPEGAQQDGAPPPSSAARSSGAVIDCNARAMLMAKWEEAEAPSEILGRQPEAHLEGMRQRLLSTAAAESLVTYTCKEIGQELRPRCRAAAPRSIFCDALGQAASERYGADALLNMMGLGA